MGHADHAESDQSHPVFSPLGPTFSHLFCSLRGLPLGQLLPCRASPRRGRDGSFFVASSPTWGKVEPGNPHDFHQSLSIFITISHDGSMVLLYLWCAMDPIKINPSHVSINIPAPLGSVMGITLYFTGKSWKIHIPYAPCMEYLPTFTLKITQM